MRNPFRRDLVLSKLALALAFSVVGSSAVADGQILDSFAETLAQRCLFEDPAGYEALDYSVRLPFFQHGSRGSAVTETVFGEVGSWTIVTVIAPSSARLTCSFSVHLPLSDVRTSIAEIEGLTTRVPPWMDPPNGQNVLVLTEGDGMQEPAFFAIVGFTSASEGDLSLTLGTISFMPLGMLYQ